MVNSLRELIHIKAFKKRSSKVTSLDGGNAREQAASDRTEKLLGTYSAPILAASVSGHRAFADATFCLPLPEHRLQRARLGR